MAQIIETSTKRRMVRINANDILNIISQYQTLVGTHKNYNEIRSILNQNNFYLPEDL